MAGPIVPIEGSQAVAPAPRPALPADFNPEPDQGSATVGPKRIVAAIFRAKWWLLAGAVIGSGTGYLVSRLMPKKFTADATVWIETRDRQNDERTSGPIRPGGFLESMQWPALVKSYVVIDSVVLKQRLFIQNVNASDLDVFEGFALGPTFDYGRFTLTVSPDGRTYSLAKRGPGVGPLSTSSYLVEAGAVGDSIGRKQGWLWQPLTRTMGKSRKVEFTVLTPREASRDLLARMTVEVEGQQFIRLGVRDRDPNRAAATLNSLTEQFVKVATTLKKRSMIEQRDILAEQVDFAGKRLRDKEMELQGFKVRTVTLPNLNMAVNPGSVLTEPTVLVDYFGKKKQRSELLRDRQAILDLLGRSEAGELTVDAFQTIPTVKDAPALKKALDELSVAETELRGLRYRYTDSLKQVQDVRQRIATLRTNVIPGLARALADQLERSAGDLDRRIATDNKELSSIPERLTTEQRLTREYEAAEDLFKNLRARLEAAQLAQASQIPDLRLLDPAVPPQKPSGLTPWMLVALGLLIGTGLVASFSVVRDLADTRINYPEQVSGGGIGLTILGVIPDARFSKSASVREQRRVQIVEAFREVRLNIIHSFHNGPVFVTISSPSQGDGKSFVSANLAVSFAQAGFDTLLIDGDTRRGILHTSFGINRKPGLVDYLLGRAELTSVIQATPHEHLSVIPSGERVGHSPELLGSARMRELSEAVRRRYAVIIIDSPPFSAGVDSYMLASLSGALVTVVRSGVTERQLAEEKLRLVDRLPVRQLGAVLNAVSATTGGYGYYLYGYSTSEEGDKQVTGEASAAIPSSTAAE